MGSRPLASSRTKTRVSHVSAREHDTFLVGSRAPCGEGARPRWCTVDPGCSRYGTCYACTRCLIGPDLGGPLDVSSEGRRSRHRGVRCASWHGFLAFARTMPPGRGVARASSSPGPKNTPETPLTSAHKRSHCAVWQSALTGTQTRPSRISAFPRENNRWAWPPSARPLNPGQVLAVSGLPVFAWTRGCRELLRSRTDLHF